MPRLHDRWRWWEILLVVVLFPPAFLLTLLLGWALDSVAGASLFGHVFWLAVPAVPMLLCCFVIEYLRYRRGEVPKWSDRAEKPAVQVTNFHCLR